jgi:hypothetical protein
VSGRPLAAAREAHLDRNLSVVRTSTWKPGADHELAVPPIDLERRDRAAAIALEEIAD